MEAHREGRPRVEGACHVFFSSAAATSLRSCGPPDRHRRCVPPPDGVAHNSVDPMQQPVSADSRSKRVSFENRTEQPSFDASHRDDDDDDDDDDRADSPTSPSPRDRLHSTIRATVTAAHMVRKTRYTMPFGDLAMTTLMHACATGSFEKVRASLDSFHSQPEALALELAAVDDWAGSSPLHWAAYSGDARIIQALLNVGAKVDVSNQRDGSLAVHLAARYGKVDALVALVDSPAGRLSVNAPNRKGDTPLHECAYEGHSEGAQVCTARPPSHRTAHRTGQCSAIFF